MQHQRPNRVFLYDRVSGQAQEQYGTSLAGQDAEGREYCRQRGYPEPIIFVEVEGGGAEKEEKRTEQRRLMALVQPGDLVLCCKQDRWSRDTLHFLASTKEIIKKGARFFSIAERFDPSTPEGKFAATIMAAVAEQEHARIKDRTVGTRRRLRLGGAHVEGLPPLGYRVEKRKLIIEPKGAEIVRRIFELSISGQSVRQVSAQILREYPGTPGVDNAAISRRLRDRRYIGESNTIGQRGRAPKGEWIKTHEPIVDKATWDAAQTSVKSRKLCGRPVSGESRNAGFLLRGVVLCGSCGHVMVAHSPGPEVSVKHGGYYLCRQRTTGPKEGRCDGPIARLDHVDANVDQEVLSRVETLASALSRPVRDDHAPKRKKNDHDADRIRLLKKQERLVDAIADGVVDRSVAKKKLAEIEAELEAVERKRAEEMVPAIAPSVDRGAMLSQVKMIHAGWSTLNVDERRVVLRLLVDRVELHAVPAKKWARGAWRLEITWRDIK